MRKDSLLFFFIICFFAEGALANAPEWREGFSVPAGGNSNPYELPADELEKNIRAGRLHAQEYPLEITGILPPHRPVAEFFSKTSFDPLRDFLRGFYKGLTGIESLNDVLEWIGLHPYPSESDQGVYAVPYPNGKRPEHPMGFSLVERNGATGFTVSCAGCHSSNLFGKTVLGMSNRFPRANETFQYGKTLAFFAEPNLFQMYNGATEAETEMLRELRSNVRSIGLKKPLTLGLDTSLAQVALSLARRNEDPHAERSEIREIFPREDPLSELPADSKPAVWWNVKYKNRWLSDGSVLSGNPILTNILWNEIGRGADLHELNDWIDRNSAKIRELTSAVFASEAPRYSDFFPAENFPLAEAKKGEEIFQQRCARCHGTYEKAWNLPHAAELKPEELMKTVFVRYHENTPVVNVGTDPHRRQGMQSLEQLNRLAISQKHGIRIETQAGYVPPPLVGIWARWPYFHNNSIPNLCALLTKPEKRPKTYYAGPAEDPARDFDSNCNGYPLGEKAPPEWKKRRYKFDSRIPGLVNMGHAEGIFLQNGKELLSNAEKQSLIRFLQSL
jgi:mono/diheme cytochrome c family protein